MLLLSTFIEGQQRRLLHFYPRSTLVVACTGGSLISNTLSGSVRHGSVSPRVSQARCTSAETTAWLGW
jgi:hypothetical protein